MVIRTFTKRRKYSHIMAKTLNKLKFSWRIFSLNAIFCYLRRRRKKILDVFLNKRSRRALRITMLRDLISNLWIFGRRGGGRIPIISPQPTPMILIYKVMTCAYTVTHRCKDDKSRINLRWGKTYSKYSCMSRSTS